MTLRRGFCLSEFLLLILIFFLSSSSLSAQSPNNSAVPTQIPGRDAILMGTDWYPEQWPESRWDAELALMQHSGVHMVRVAEFAWSRMEPEEGNYDFDWLDRAITAAAKHNIYTVIGTPTAAPPAWLTQKYPENLRMNAAATLTVPLAKSSFL